MKFKDYKKAGEKYGIGGDWMRFKEGDNKVRIISEFEDFGQHFDQEKNQSFICLGKDKCPYCENGEDARVQYMGWIIDRRDKQIKLATIGHQIFKQIGAYANSEEYAFKETPDYDINIKRSGTGLETEYNVIPDRKDKKLTKDEEAKIKDQTRDPKEVLETMKERQESPEDEGAGIKEEDIPY